MNCCYQSSECKMFVKKIYVWKIQVQQIGWIASLTLLLEVLATFFWYYCSSRFGLSFLALDRECSVILCSIIRVVHTGPVSVFGYMIFWYRYGSGSADPCHLPTDPAREPDSALFVIGFQDAKKNNFSVFCWFPTFWRYIFIILLR